MLYVYGNKSLYYIGQFLYVLFLFSNKELKRRALLGVFGVADHEYDIEIFRTPFRKRWAWPKIMICIISFKFDILLGNRVRGARNAHLDFPHTLPEVVGVA
jgi:hypothetical protein